MAEGLLPRDERELRQLVEQIAPLLCPRTVEIMNDYVETAIEEQHAGTLWLHEHDDWNDQHSYRYGKPSVYGTVAEFLCQGKIETGRLGIWSFAHGYKEQVLEHIDGWISSPAGTFTVSVKHTYNNTTLGGYRLGDNYFPTDSKADILMIADLDTLNVYMFDYEAIKSYFRQHAVEGRDNSYCYRPMDDMLTCTKGKIL